MNRVLTIAGIVLLVAAFIWHEYDRSRAYEQGQTAERALSLAEAEATRKDQQAQIKAIEAEYWQKEVQSREQSREQIDALEAALREEKRDPACGPAISRRLRDQLNQIGVPRNNP